MYKQMSNLHKEKFGLLKNAKELLNNRKHPSNVFILPDVSIYDMVAGRSCGGSFDEITGHCNFTVKRAVFINNNQST